MLRTRRQILGALVAAQILTGCARWEVVHVSPRALVDSAHVRALQVHEQSGATYVLDHPSVVGDSLMGLRARVPHGVPLAVVDRLAVKQSDETGTILLIVGVVIGLLLQLRSGFSDCQSC